MYKKVACLVLCASMLTTGFPISASAAFEKTSMPVGIMASAEEEQEEQEPAQEKEGLVKENSVYHYYENGELVKTIYLC